MTKPSEDKLTFSKLRTSLIIMGIFWVVAIVLWQTTGKIFYVFNFGYIGTAIGIGGGIYGALPKKRKYQGRRLSQLLVGVYMLVFLGFIKFENMQIEGFFLYLLAGFFGGATIHFVVKVALALFINRGWCSWCCWTAMILDYLPFSRNKQGRLSTKWGNLRYVHFALSLGLILVLWYGFGYRVQPGGSTNELYWIIVGNVLYYAIAITLAFALKDNRAFCKYVCPITAMLKVTSRFSLLKIAGDAEKCNDCGACEKVCPTDIRIIDYIKNGQRVLSTECILCFECENVCVPGALKSTWGFDCGTKELLNMKKQQEK